MPSSVHAVLSEMNRKIFTKEELYESVWEETYLPGDNTLNAHLSNLRKKLAQLDRSTDYISVDRKSVV